MEVINITRNGKSAIKHIMEDFSIDIESADVLAVNVVSEMLVKKCFRRIHIDEIPSITYSLESLAESFKNLMANEEIDILTKRYEKLCAEMSATTMIMEVNDDSL